MTRALAIAALMLWAGEAVAHPLQCLPYAKAKALLEKGGFEPGENGMSHGHEIWRLYRKEDGGWTLIFVTPSGLLCRVATGDRWSVMTLPQPGAPT